MKKNPDFEDNYFSEIVEGIQKDGHYSIRILKGSCYAVRSVHENSKNFDLMVTVLTCLNEVSFWWIPCRSKKWTINYPSKWNFGNTKTYSSKIIENWISSSETY